MWMPTHTQVTVQKAVGLLAKGKNGTNDCLVTIALGKVKYQTSIKEKAGSEVEWHEECDLPIPEQGNTAEIVLTVLHRNFMGVDEFLGRASIPLNSVDVYERPKNKWYTLESKPGKTSKQKERGRLEVKIGFTVKSGSLTDLNKKEKHKLSIGQLSNVAQNVGGSLLSLGTLEKRKGIKKFAKSIGSKLHLKGKKKEGDSDDGSNSIGSVGSLKIRNNSNFDKFKSKDILDNADPGVNSDDEDGFTLDDLSHKSSTSSLSQTNSNIIAANVEKASTPPAKPPRHDAKPQDEWEYKLFGKNKNLLKPGSENLNRRSWDSSKLASQIEEEDVDLLDVPKQKQEDKISLKSNKSPEPVKKEERDGLFDKFKNFRKDREADMKQERIVIGGENYVTPKSPINRISNEMVQKYEGKSRDDLILELCDKQEELKKEKKKLKDLEDYLDDLLLRVMETQPKILQNPYMTCKLTHSQLS